MKLDRFRKNPLIYGLYLSLIKYKHDKNLIGERLSLGELNPDKIFFIIKINNHGLGLMNIFGCVLGYLYFAHKNNFIPIVDLKNYMNGYLEKDEIGKINAWEYYFNQPTSFSLDEVYKSKNVIMASGVSPREGSPIPLIFYNRYFIKNTARKYYNLIKTQMTFKKNILDHLNKEFENVVGEKRVIGVVKRGTDMIKAPGHQIQPTIELLLNDVKEKLLIWNCDYVFLATEEEKTVEVFKNEFKDKLLINNSARVKNYDERIAYTNISFNRENDKYLKGLEYLTTVYILSKCNCLIGSKVGATSGALSLNMGKYENVYIYDLGQY